MRAGRGPVRRRGSGRSAPRSPRSRCAPAGAPAAEARRRCRARPRARARAPRSRHAPRRSRSRRRGSADRPRGSARTHSSGSRREPRGRWVSAITAAITRALRARPGRRAGHRRAAPAPRRRRSARRGRTPSSGAGRRRTRAVHSRGGRRISAGKSATAAGTAIRSPGASRQRSRASARVDPHRRPDRPGRPVEGEEVAEVVLGEAALDLALAVRPAPVLVDQPGGEAGRRVVRGPAASASGAAPWTSR